MFDENGKKKTHFVTQIPTHIICNAAYHIQSMHELLEDSLKKIKVFKGIRTSIFCGPITIYLLKCACFIMFLYIFYLHVML